MNVYEKLMSDIPEGLSPLIKAIMKECSETIEKSKVDAPEFAFYIALKVNIAQLVKFIEGLTSDNDNINLNYQNQNFQLSRSSPHWQQLKQLDERLSLLNF